MDAEHAGRVQNPRGLGTRIPGWHAPEVNEALILLRCMKEEIADASRDLRAAAAGAIDQSEQRHLELLGAQLYAHVKGDAAQLAQAIRFVRHAAAVAALGEAPSRPAGPLSVLPAPSRPAGEAS